MHGFKSFVRKTEIEFTKEINVVVGANGSGKSNISDALCFVLGRLGIKSMRASKAGNLIFLGTKAAPPAKEASVEVIFDNSDNIFTINKPEISIKRIVRKNGQSIYKINNEVKTRQDVLILLAQAGVDPNGYNIILQGEIQNLARMHTEERRKIIEEVSGISIYESRKERSLKELEKTDEKLKEIISILRERTTYLNNLEKERQQALRFKKLEGDLKKFKASVIFNDLFKKRKESERVNSEIADKTKIIEKIKKSILETQTEIKNIESKITSINSKIQQSTGFEQEKLNQEIADTRANLAGLNVKLENFENKISEILKQKEETKRILLESELKLREFQKESPTIEKKQKEIEKKKKEIELIEEQRKKFYMVKSELKSLKEMLQDKTSSLTSLQSESEFLIRQIESTTSELFDRKTDRTKVNALKNKLTEKKELLSRLDQREIDLEKQSYNDEHEIGKLKRLKDDISKIDICPLCKSKITPEHIKSITNETLPKIKSFEIKIEESKKEISEIINKKTILKDEIDKISDELLKRDIDLIKISRINEKKEQIKNLNEKIEKIKEELSRFQKRKKTLEENFDENSNIEQKYETLRIELQEISIITEENVDSETSFKKREIERLKVTLKQLSRDEEDFNVELNEIKKEVESKGDVLEKKRIQEEELSKKFKQLIAERDSLQTSIRQYESEITKKQLDSHNFDNEINNLKIENARVNAEISNLETEMLSYPDIQVIKMNRDELLERINKTQEVLSNIGGVNLRSLEVYDSVKKEYDLVKEKADLIEKEKEGIMKIIHEIDIKKKKTFFKTLEALNEIFSRNFAQLSTKGQVFLELENRKEPFEGGVSIVVKTGQGKYFDVTSLSGGEQTIVALSLIFAIQEYKPYCFYILDEIDAALDKQNSERLSELLKKYLKRGQYIVISHNDGIIASASTLYGVTMHEGISKIVSLKL